jgi:hypothetical protein
MDYTTVEEILTSESFLKWYQQTDDMEVRLWSEWMDQNPDRQALVNEAIQLFKLIGGPERCQMTEEQIKTDAFRLVDAIRTMKDKTELSEGSGT